MTPTLWAPSRHCSDALLFSDARWAHLPPPVWMPGWVPQPAGPAVYVLEYVPLLLDDEVRWGEVICEPVAPRSPCALLFFGLVWFCAAVACTVRRAVGPTDQWEWRGGEGVRASGRVVKGIRWEGGEGRRLGRALCSAGAHLLRRLGQLRLRACACLCFCGRDGDGTRTVRMLSGERVYRRAWALADL